MDELMEFEGLQNLFEETKTPTKTRSYAGYKSPPSSLENSVLNFNVSSKKNCQHFSHSGCLDFR